jgi:hypothetical protein
MIMNSMRGNKRKSQKGIVGTSDLASSLPTLEEILVGFQKSLARATLAAYNTSKADPEFTRGTRTLYITEALDVDLKAGLSIASARSGKQPDRITIDFDAPPDFRSSLRFRVGTKPLEHIKGPELILASLDPVGSSTSTAHFRLYLINEERHHIPRHPVKIRIAPRDIDAEIFEVELKTDDYGAITFIVYGETGIISVKGEKFTPPRNPSFKDSVVPAWLLSAEAIFEQNSKESLVENTIKLRSDIYVISV